MPTNDKPITTPKLALNCREACHALGISRVTLWRLIKRGLIRPNPHLRTVIISAKELEKFLAA